ncbi:MAG TPA: sigma-70 family RNA polymerase sigma factor [Phycisphaerae bacterium]|jgi:RNA polymerase sigma factor (sigma-70 family)
MRPPDDELLRQSIAGDQAALGRLLRRYEPVLRRDLAGKIPKRWRALVSDDDIIQQTWTDVHLDIQRRKPVVDGFAAWIKAMARNNLIEVLRAFETEKRGGRHATETVVPDGSRDLCELLAAPSSAAPSREAARGEIAHALRDAIEHLSGSHRRVVELYDLEGRPIEEVAAAVQRSPGAVYLLRNRAHRRLRELLGASTQFFSKPA